MAAICDTRLLFRFKLVPAPFNIREKAPAPLASVPDAPGKLRLFAVIDKALPFELIVVPLPTLKAPTVATALFALNVKAPFVLILPVTLMPLLAVYVCAAVAESCESSVLFRFKVAPTPFNINERAPMPLFSVFAAPGKLKLFAVMDKALLFELIIVPLPTVNVPEVPAPLLALKVKAPLVLILLVTLMPFVVV